MLKKITTFTSGAITYDMPSKPTEFLAFWEEKFNEVPEEYRDSTEIEFEADMDYDDSFCSVKIYYYRPETEEEKEEREARETQKKRHLEALERQQLVFLQKKYGGNNDKVGR